jgi:hypothetical protein
MTDTDCGNQWRTISDAGAPVIQAFLYSEPGWHRAGDTINAVLGALATSSAFGSAG